MNPTELRLRIWEMVMQKDRHTIIDNEILDQLAILAEHIFDKIKNPQENK